MNEEVYIGLTSTSCLLGNLITPVSPIEILRFSLIALKCIPIASPLKSQNKNKHTKSRFDRLKNGNTISNNVLKTTNVSNKFP